MTHTLVADLPAGIDGPTILERLSRVLDPELDESILELGFIQSLRLHDGQATITLQLPTSWCAINFVYIIAEDVRDALLAAGGIEQVIVRVGDHAAAREIEAAVNSGKRFAAAFAGERAEGLSALRLCFCTRDLPSARSGYCASFTPPVFLTERLVRCALLMRPRRQSTG